MALTNAERQRRWRDKRNELAEAFAGTPKELAEKILSHLGIDNARKVVRALDKRLRNIKPDCRACRGTGFIPMDYSTACGMHLWSGRWLCDCGPMAEALAEDRDRREAQLRNGASHNVGSGCVRPGEVLGEDHLPDADPDKTPILDAERAT
jgi:hypothetical protein